MFRKLVSNLPFSPALVGQIGFYARRLRKEEATRRLGLFMTALALIVQSFSVFIPPSPANAANASDFIYGGASTVSAVLVAYDNPNADIKKIMDYAGITRSELASMKDVGINSQERGKGAGAWLTWGRQSRFSTAQGQVEHNISGTVVYSKPLWLYDSTSWTTSHGSYYEAFVGNSAKMGAFAIVKGCGNLVSTKNPSVTPPPPVTVTVCRPGTGVIQINIGDKKTSDLDASSSQCKPTGACSLLSPPVITNRTNVALSSKATVGGGATVQSHVFTLHDSTGAQVNQRIVTSSDTTATASMSLTTPGNYTARVVIMTSEGKKMSPDCEKPFTILPPPAVITPIASCSILTVNSIDRTHVGLTAKASVEHGATIKGYKFTIRQDNANGPIATEKSYTSSAVSYTTESIEIANSGTYYASVTVMTSEGDRGPSSNPNCGQTFPIAPPDKCQYNPALLKKDADCQPCEGNTTLWHKSPECVEKIVKQKVAINLTQGSKDATTLVADQSDHIQYTLTLENTGKTTSSKTVFQEDLGDVLEYATVLDNGGGTLDAFSKVLSWQSVQLKPGEKQTRTFIVSMLPSIPTVARGQSEPTSYDCVMNNVFGNNTQIRVNCPLPKIVEQTVSELPSTGPTENAIFATVIGIVVTFFWARSRQLGKEVRLVRKDFSASTI